MASSVTRSKQQNNVADPHKEWKNDILQSLDEWDDRNASEITLWGIETIKHVALISLAGLAGVFAVVGAGKSSYGVLAAGVLFAISSILSTLCMYLAHLARLDISERIRDTREKIVSGKYQSPRDWVDDSTFEQYVFWGNGLGIVAAVLIVIGGASLFSSLAAFATKT